MNLNRDLDYGCFDRFSSPEKSDVLNHQPTIGYRKGDGDWCPECKATGFYNWNPFGSCPCCEERSEKKPSKTQVLKTQVTTIQERLLTPHGVKLCK